MARLPESESIAELITIGFREPIGDSDTHVHRDPNSFSGPFGYLHAHANGGAHRHPDRFPEFHRSFRDAFQAAGYSAADIYVSASDPTSG